MSKRIAIATLILALADSSQAEIVYVSGPSFAIPEMSGAQAVGINNDGAPDFIFKPRSVQKAISYQLNRGASRKQFPISWGDYSATVVDPRNNADLWTIQEYAATPAPSGLTNGTGRWATRWGQLKVTVPNNDNFANSISLGGSQGSTNGTTIRATKESGEPSHVGNTNTVSVWYQWTAPTNGNVVMDTKGSLLNTLLAVYTGSAVSSLTLVASDDDSGGGGASQVVFNGSVGTTYSIAVAGSGGSMSDFVLNWNQPLAPVFTLQPQSRSLYQGNNVTFTANAIGRPDPAYQWRLNGGNVSAATNASYTITSVQTNHAGNYTVVASNSSGSVTSAVAGLTVLTS